jgi:hypothetical protein
MVVLKICVPFNLQAAITTSSRKHQCYVFLSKVSNYYLLATKAPDLVNK